MTKEETHNRTALYALISRLWIKEVDCDFLKTIQSDEAILAMFPDYQTWQKRTELPCETLVSAYYNVDFTNLTMLDLVPYESFYTREDQMIESGGDNPVITLYNDYGFRVELDVARVVSPDHIGVELEFMYMLCNAQQKAIETADEMGVCELMKIQRTFLKEHLLTWTPMFLINAKRESRTPLYHNGAELTLEFLLSDFEYLSAMIGHHCHDMEE